MMSRPACRGESGCRAPMETAEGRPGVAATLQALNGALGRPAGLWVKESSARNLRHRDFLAPRAALSAAFTGGQVGRGGAGRPQAGPARRGAGPRARPVRRGRGPAQTWV